MKILITICARGGSKGIPGKNIKPLNGIPLIEYTITKAFKFAQKKDVVVALSTDDEDILKISRSAGLNTNYKRPKKLAQDDTGKQETIKDVLLYQESLLNEKFDFILDLDVSSPLRSKEDLTRSFNTFLNNKESLSLFSVNNSHRNPYFNMVEEGKSGYFNLVKIPETNILSRQKAPKVYDLNASFYWYRRSFFNDNYETPVTEKSLVFLTDHICFDLDHQNDFDYMEYLIQNEKLDFKL
tara:strand:+ start:71 stop:790 length:720 start_codon:yes stop_codon:yes gene_type:complete